MPHCFGIVLFRSLLTVHQLPTYLPYWHNRTLSWETVWLQPSSTAALTHFPTYGCRVSVQIVLKCDKDSRARAYAMEQTRDLITVSLTIFVCVLANDDGWRRWTNTKSDYCTRTTILWTISMLLNRDSMHRFAKGSHGSEVKTNGTDVPLVCWKNHFAPAARRSLRRDIARLAHQWSWFGIFFVWFSLLCIKKNCLWFLSLIDFESSKFVKRVFVFWYSCNCGIVFEWRLLLQLMQLWQTLAFFLSNSIRSRNEL